MPTAIDVLELEVLRIKGNIQRATDAVAETMEYVTKRNADITNYESQLEDIEDAIQSLRAGL